MRPRSLPCPVAARSPAAEGASVVGGRLRSALWLGVAVAVAGIVVSLASLGSKTEENAGLDWLYGLRGARPTPPGIVLVSMDGESADELGLHEDPARWPRGIHARFLQRLMALQPRLVVFDVFFDDPPDAPGTTDLAAAIGQAGNVVLVARLGTRLVALGPRAADGEAVQVSLRMPTAPLREAALAVAPFPLPVVPFKVGQFWTFQDGAGGVPTVPAVVVQALAWDRAPAVRSALLQSAPAMDAAGAAIAGQDMTGFVQATRTLAEADPGFKARALAGRHAGDSLYSALVDLYTGPPSRYLNYYGPPRTIPTVSYHRLLNGQPAMTRSGQAVDLRDAVVFVGYAARHQAEQRDSFYSVFSQESGLNLSGMEIAATATANLLEGRGLHPLPQAVALALLLAWGLALGLLCQLLPGWPGIAAAAVAAQGYLLAAAHGFEHYDIWPPLLVPIFVQAPLAVFGALLMNVQRLREQRARVMAAVGHYLPEPVVRGLAEDGLSAIRTAELVHGTCMSTDVEGYTRLAESLAPDELGEVMNAYYGILFREVSRHGGQVSDAVGDSMMAIWASARPEADTRRGACLAAADIHQALERAASAGAKGALPTRIGLHSGAIRLGTVGAGQHLEYRVLGDIVNTASRIEGLNKRLGTRVLASAETVVGIEGVLTRDVGAFYLAGKGVPVQVHQLLGHATDAGATCPEEALQLFAEALAEFRSGRWMQAEERFRRSLGLNAGDRVASFYAELCAAYQRDGATSFLDGAIRIDMK